MTLQHLRSSTANKRPDPTAMADGQIALNTAAASPGLFYKDSAGNLVKAGPVHVGSTAPNVSPASGGTAGNSTGESWLDTSGSNPLLKVWNGSSWQTVQPVASGTVVSTADTGSVTSTMIANGTIVDADVNASAAIAGTKISPNFGSQNVTTTGTSTAASFIPTSSTVPTNGVYLPAANSVAISTNSTGRLFIDSSGKVGIGATPEATLHVAGSASGAYIAQIIQNQNAGGYSQQIFRVGTGAGTKEAGISYAPGIFLAIGPTANDTTTPIVFHNNNAQERLRITAAGLVGVGTSTPGYKLNVNGSGYVFGLDGGGTSRIAQLFQNTSGQLSLGLESSAGGALMTGATAYSSCIGSDNATSLHLGTNGTVRATIDSSGRLGIGTSSPVSNLHVNTSGTGDYTSFFLSNSGASGRSYQIGVGGSGTLAGYANNLYVFDNIAAVIRIVLDPSGRVGIGSNAPLTPLHVAGSGDTPALIDCTGGTNSHLYLRNTGGGAYVASASNDLVFKTTGSAVERARLTSDGKWLVGTSSVRTTGWSTQGAGEIFQELTGYGGITCFTNANNEEGTFFTFGKSRGTAVGSNTVVQNNDRLGGINFQGTDGSASRTAAHIHAFVDGTPGANDMPGRLVFSTTADGVSSPTERLRISNGGSIYQNFASRRDTGNDFSQFAYTGTNPVLELHATNGSFANNDLLLTVNRAATSAYQFLSAFSSGAADLEFSLYGDGNGKCDGAWTGGGADYAEYFEWSDNNPEAEDRRGISVVLDGDKIREAQPGEDPIGVISGNPSVVGDAAWNKWSGKYLRDEFGTYIQEDYEVTDDNGNTVIQQRRKLNPVYDPDVEYISREQRPEWDCVGLMGKLRIRKGQVTGSRWIKMRDISDSVEEWLVR